MSLRSIRSVGRSCRRVTKEAQARRTPPLIAGGILSLALLGLTACGTLEDEVSGGYATHTTVGGTPTAFTTANVRVVMERTHLQSNKKIICTEPPPDTAKAIEAVLGLTAKGGNGPVNAGLGFTAGSAQAVMELAGRSTALLGLRDGLYRACEAYANGAIGADAYALVLTRYGQLMTTLFLGQDITGAAGTAHGGTITAPTVNVNAPDVTVQTGTQSNSGQSSNQSGSGNNSGKGDSTGQNQSTSDSKSPTANTGAGADQKNSQVGSGAAQTQIAQASTDKGNNSNQGTPSGNTPPAATPKADSGTDTGNPAAVPNISAIALTRMNEDYFALDLDPLHVLLVACINAGDPTRYHGAEFAGIENPYLKAKCEDLTVKNIGDYIERISAHLPPPVDPVVAITMVKPQGTQTPKANSPVVTVSASDPARIIQAQQALRAAGCDPMLIDGKMGPRTQACITLFQEKMKLKVTGTLDADTSRALHVM